MSVGIFFSSMHDSCDDITICTMCRRNAFTMLVHHFCTKSDSLFKLTNSSEFVITCWFNACTSACVWSLLLGKTLKYVHGNLNSSSWSQLITNFELVYSGSIFDAVVSLLLLWCCTACPQNNLVKGAFIFSSPILSSAMMRI